MLFVVIIFVVFEGIFVDDFYFFLGSRKERRLAGFPSFFFLVLFFGLLSFDVLFFFELSDFIEGPLGHAHLNI